MQSGRKLGSEGAALDVVTNGCVAIPVGLEFPRVRNRKRIEVLRSRALFVA